MKSTSKTLLSVLASTVMMLGAVDLAQAGPNVDVTGTWTWTGGGFGGFGGGGGGGGGRRGGFGGGGTNVLVLKADVSTGMVTGTLTMPAFGGRGRRGAAADDGTAPPAPPAPTPIEIKNGKIAGNELSFEVTRAGRGGGPDTTIQYKATISADGKTITGTTVTPVAFTASKQE